MSSSLALLLYIIWTKSKRMFLGNHPMKRQNVGGEGEMRCIEKGNYLSRHDSCVYFIMNGVLRESWWGAAAFGWGLEGE